MLPHPTETGKTEYHQVPGDEFPPQGEVASSDALRWTRRYFIAILISLVVLAGIIFARDVTTQLTNQHPHDFDWTPCGNTSMEARVNNCHFDPMLISWVPEACYIFDPSEEYDVSEFKWFSDEKRTQPMDVDTIRSGDYSQVFTDGSHHDQHCIYTWRKLSIAIERRLLLLDTKTADFHHSTHCAQGVRGIVGDALHNVDMYKGTYSSIPLAFAGCVPLFI